MTVLLVSLFDEWCLGLRALSAFLKSRGPCRVVLVGLGSQSEMRWTASKDPIPGELGQVDLAALQQIARDLQPGLIGLSVTSDFFDMAARVTRSLREAVSAPIIWGGVEPTANPDLSLQVADFVCRGEGEGALLDLVERLEAGVEVSNIPNLWSRRDGVVSRNALRPLIADLDRLPWPDFAPRDKYHIVRGVAREGLLPDQSELQRSYPLLSGRGCPHSCAHCCHSVLRDLYGANGYTRTRSVSGVIDEIAHVIRSNRHLEYIQFHDDIFGLDLEWLRQFASIYPKRIGLPFFCYVHPNAMNPERAQLLKNAGLGLAGMGIQSGSERTRRDLYRRSTPRESIIQAMESLHDAQIPVTIQLIGANPLETEEDHRETLDLLLALPRPFVLREVFDLIAYRNFPIWDKLRKAGLLEPGSEDLSVGRIAYRPEFRFWRALFLLCQFPLVGADAVRRLAEDAALRECPEVIEGLAVSLVEATFPQTSYRSYAETVRLAQEELAALRGSRAVRLGLRIRDWGRRLL